MKIRNIAAVLIFAIFASLSVSGQQHRFEGESIILEAPYDHKSYACATGYAPPTNLVTITDLDPSTPLNIRSCAGSASAVVSSAGGKAVLRPASSSSWCFTGEDESYKIEFDGDGGKVEYYWRAQGDPRDAGFLNIRDFGAKGDGVTDDTLAIRSALAYAATRNGAVLRFPEGDYLVGARADFRPLVLPSGVTLEGISGLHSGASSNNNKRTNPSRIILRGANRSLFRIGECTEMVSLKDIELIAETSENTIGIEASGAYISSQGFSLERVTFNGLFRGIWIYGLPQTNLSWQFDYVKIKECRFIFNTDAGIYTNIRNANLRVEGAMFVNSRKTDTQNGDSMRFERVGAVIVSDTFGGGFPDAKGGTFLKLVDTGPLTIINSETEAMTASLDYNDIEDPSMGDYSWPITVVNSWFADPIIFRARRTFVSTGSYYGPDTFRADERLRVYSTGDRFCLDGIIIGCVGGTKRNFDGATVVFMTGQPGEGKVQGHPTYFGTDVEFGAPVKMPSIPFGSLPSARPDGSMVFCPDCQRSSDPCRAGGKGAPAMVVNGAWTCL